MRLHPHIVAGYVFGVIWGLGYGFFRFNHDAAAPWYWIAVIVVLGSFTVAGAIGAFGGLLVVIGEVIFRRIKYGRSPVIRD